MKRAEVLFEYLQQLASSSRDQGQGQGGPTYVSSSLASSARRMTVMAYHHLMEGYRIAEDLESMWKLAQQYKHIPQKK
jgi:hypothetical protein